MLKNLRDELNKINPIYTDEDDEVYRYSDLTDEDKHTQFSKGCKINLKKTLSEMDVKITPKQEKEIDDFINLAKDIVMAIDKDSLKVNFNRELLKVHLGIGSDTPHITLKELLAYLKKEKYKESSCKNRMRLSSSDKEFRRIIQEIADKLEAKKNKRKTKVSTKAA